MKTLVNDYLALWNERDAARRATVITALFTEDAVYSCLLYTSDAADE